MRVLDVMTREVKTCGGETNLAQAVGTMWENDCGFLPVVDEDRRVKGVITDRDIAVAVGTRGRTAAEIRVCEVTTEKAYTCKPEDDLEDAVDTMRANKISRLPVVDAEGHVQGVLTIGDVIARATNGRTGKIGGLPTETLIETLQSVSGHRPKTVRPSRRPEIVRTT